MGDRGSKKAGGTAPSTNPSANAPHSPLNGSTDPTANADPAHPGLESNSTVDDRIRRKQLGCSHCPPHRRENQGRRARHGAQKPRYKK